MSEENMAFKLKLQLLLIQKDELNVDEYIYRLNKLKKEVFRSINSDLNKLNLTKVKFDFKNINWN